MALTDTDPHAAVAVRRIREPSNDLLRQINALIVQLSTSSPPLTAGTLQRLLAADGSFLFVAERADRVIGTLCLVVFQCPTGTRAFIEDVVIDAAERRAGIAQSLTHAAIEQARRAGARTIDLTCRPERLAANRLYQKLGFNARQTNFYRLECG